MRVAVRVGRWTPKVDRLCRGLERAELVLILDTINLLLSFDPDFLDVRQVMGNEETLGRNGAL